MKWRSSLVLLALAVAVGAFILLYERNLPSTNEAIERADRLFAFEGDDVSWIEIESDGTSLRFERETPEGAEQDGALETWRLTAPIEDRADRFLVSGLADRIAGLKADRDLSADDAVPSDEAAGLAPPAATIRFDAGEGPVTLHAGRSAPGTGSIFLRLPGEGRTVLVPSNLTDGLDRDLSGWRDANLFDLSTLDVEALDVTRPAGPLAFRKQRGDWTLVEPVADEARGSAVQGLLGAVLGLRAVAFHPDDEPAAGEVEGKTARDTGLADPAYGVRLALGGGGEERIAFGSPTGPDGGHRYARVSGRPGVVEVAGGVIDRLEEEAGTFRALRLVSLREFEIDALSIESNAGALSLEKVDGEWRATSPEGFAIDPVEVTRTLGMLVDLEAARIVGPAPGPGLAAYGLAPPAARVTISSGGDEDEQGEEDDSGEAAAAPGGRSETILIGGRAEASGEAVTDDASSAGLVHVMKEGRPWILTAPDELPGRLDLQTHRAKEPANDEAGHGAGDGTGTGTEGG